MRTQIDLVKFSWFISPTRNPKPRESMFELLPVAGFGISEFRAEVNLDGRQRVFRMIDLL